jgi:hypothetical protein
MNEWDDQDVQPDEGPLNARLRSPKYVLLLAIFAALLVLTIAGVITGSEPEESSTGIDEDFTNPSQTWNPVDDGNVTASITGDRYVVSIKQPDYTFVDEAIWSGAIEFNDMEAGATAVMESGGSGRFGIVCYSNPGTAEAPGGVFARYEFFITSSGGYGVAKWLNGSSEILELKEKGPVDPAKDNELSVSCSGGEPATLSMSVNGEALLKVNDPSGLGSFEGTGVLVASLGKPGITVAFDDVSAGPAD